MVDADIALPESERPSILAVAEAAARRSGEILMEHLGRLDSSDIQSKSAARDLVTAADVASERALCQTLREAFPEALHFLLDTVTSPEPEPPHESLIVAPHFHLP